MLTRSQIQRLAQRNHIGMQVQERDYLQHLLLWLLYSRSQSLIFKGGTALRLVYRGTRYSEDLDYNLHTERSDPTRVDDVRHLWQKVVDGLIDFGIQAMIRNEWKSPVGYSFDVSYQGPLYNGRDRTKGKVRVDINRRPEIVKTVRELVTSEYDDVRPFVVTVLTQTQMLAEKVRALLVRGKPRDLYDIWLLLNQGVTFDRSLVEHKLSLYDMTFSAEILDQALNQVRDDWERDLQPLLPQFVSYQDARRGVASLA